MKRILLPLLVVVALGLLGTLLWFQLGRNRTGTDRGRDAATASSASATRLDATPTDLAAPDSSSKAERANVSADANAAALAGNIVEGEVRAPEDCVLDTDVE